MVRDSSQVETILQKALNSERITQEEGEILYKEADLLSLGQVADVLCCRRHLQRKKTYIIDRNINYTNICTVRCDFCAFCRRPDNADAYTLSLEEICEKIEALLQEGGHSILLQGGINPAIKLDDHLDLLRALMKRFPDLYIHGFSPPEIAAMAKASGHSLREVLIQLKDAGLRSIPGGGAEILSDRVRRMISPRKCSADEWLDVMRQAHKLNIPSSATMMFGHVETIDERISHLARLRDLQDETGGFTAFISWTFQPENTRLAIERAGTHVFLKNLAVSRIFLDNFDNIQTSWVTQGPLGGQVSLRFGANDFGSVMLEENVVHAAGACFSMTKEEMSHLIGDIGYEAILRDYQYRTI